MSSFETMSKAIGIEDFSAPELRPFLERIGRDDALRLGIEAGSATPDARHWVGAMTLKALEDASAAEPGRLVAGVGAGVDPLIFALADAGAVVFACDTYLELTGRSDVTPASMMTRPSQFTVTKAAWGHVIPVHSDPRRIALPNAFCDGVFVLDALASLDSLDAVDTLMAEVARVLKPGGAASISGLLRLDGPNDRRWPRETGVLLTADTLQRHVIGAPGLQAEAPFSSDVSEQTFGRQSVLHDFMRKALKTDTLQAKENVPLNLIFYQDGFVFCPFHVALRRSADVTSGRPATTRSLESSIEERSIAVAGVLSQQILDWTAAYETGEASASTPSGDSKRLADDLAEAHACLAHVTAENFRNEAALLALQEGGPAPQWILEEVARVPAASLQSMVGVREADELRSDGTPGVLSYGPYMSLGPGHFVAEFTFTPFGRNGQLHCAVTGGGTAAPQLTVDIASLRSRVTLPFTLDHHVSSALEFPVTVSASVEVKLHGIRVLRRRPIPA